MAIVPGLSSLGIKVGWAAKTADYETLPTTVTMIPRCNSIDAIDLSVETIDASALEDYTEKSVAGRAATGGSWNVVWNNTPEVRTALQAMVTSYKSGKDFVWIEVYDPKDTAGAMWVAVQPPEQLPFSELSQNSLKTLQVSFTIVSYYGYANGVEPIEA